MSNRKSYFTTTRIVMIALFGALAGVLHIFKFPLSFFPNWLEFDFSDIPLFIGTFALGPVSGCIIVVVRQLVKLVSIGTENMFVGELANLLVGWAFVIPAGIIYSRLRTKKGALVALCVGAAASVAVAIIANRLILIPFYVNIMFGGSFEPLLGMIRPLFPAITAETFYRYYLWLSVLPFNAVRCLIAGCVCFILYKHISRLLNSFNERHAPKGGKKEARLRDVIIIAVCIAAVLLLVLFIMLRYFLWD